MTEPTQEELLALHEQLRAGQDPSVAARMAELLVPALERRFRSARAGDPHAVASLIGLSVARYLQEPGRYDPARGPLLAYLYRDVRGDLLNEQAAARRVREQPAGELVEVQEPAGNPGVEEEVLDALDPFDAPPDLLEAGRAELERFDARDRELLDLMLHGVRETSAYAEVLGIAHLPVATQRTEVKRHKDRLKRRLEASRDRLRRTR